MQFHCQIRKPKFTQFSRRIAFKIWLIQACFPENGQFSQSPSVVLHPDLKTKTRRKMNGMLLSSILPGNSYPVVFFDPQNPGILVKLKYGNVGESRGRKRANLRQMSEDKFAALIREIDRILIPSGNQFLWVDKFHLCHAISY